MKKKTTATRVKKINLAQLKKDVWKIVSIAVRLRDADNHGQVECISCNYKGYYIRDKIQAGHFFQSRNYPNIRYNFDNIHGQCAKCNMGLHGNIYRYYMKLKGKIGQKKIDVLDNTGNNSVKITIEYLLKVKEDSIKVIQTESQKKKLYDWKTLFTKKELETWLAKEI